MKTFICGVCGKKSTNLSDIIKCGKVPDLKCKPKRMIFSRNDEYMEFKEFTERLQWYKNKK